MLKKDEWERLIGNFSYLTQEFLQKPQESLFKIKDFYEFLFNLTRVYTLYYENDQKNQKFERKLQIEAFLHKIKRNHGLSDPSQYLLELNCENLMFSENDLAEVSFQDEESLKVQEPLVREFALLLNTGFSNFFCKFSVFFKISSLL